MYKHGKPKRRALRSRRLVLGAALVSVLALLGVEDLRGALPFPTGFAGLDPVSDRELADMRGGFLLANGVVLAFRLRFRTLVDHVQVSFEEFTDESPELENFTGVINTVTIEPGDPDPDITIEVEPTTEITGIMNVIQNNVSGVTIQNQNSLTLDLSNVNQAIAAGQANNLNFRLRARIGGALEIGGRHPPRTGFSEGTALSGRSVLQIECARDRYAATARAPRRHRSAVHVLRPEVGGGDGSDHTRY